MSDKLKTQLYVGKLKPHIKNFKLIVNRPMFCKPMGGLWTSTYDEKLGSDWIQWSGTGPRLGESSRWCLIPRNDAKVLTIDSWADFALLCHTGYTQENPHPELLSGFGILDFGKLALEYDAIHLTEKGERETRWVMFDNDRDYKKYGMFGLYGWDCESTLWLHWKFEIVKKMAYVDYSSEDVVE